MLTAPERLDAVAVRELGAAWILAGESARLVLDLGATRFIDSTGVGLLVRLRKQAGQRGSTLTLCRCTPAIDRALALMRIGEFFERSASVPSAPPATPETGRAPAVAVAPTPAGLSIAWSGEITAVNAAELGREVEPRITTLAPGTRVEIDLAQVTFVDSTGIGLFVGLKKRAGHQEVLVHYRNPGPAVRNVMRLTSLESYLLEDRRS